MVKPELQAPVLKKQKTSLKKKKPPAMDSKQYFLKKRSRTVRIKPIEH